MILKFTSKVCDKSSIKYSREVDFVATFTVNNTLND